LLLARLAILPDSGVRWELHMVSAGTGSEKFYERFGFRLSGHFTDARGTTYQKYRSYFYPSDWTKCRRRLASAAVSMVTFGIQIPPVITFDYTKPVSMSHVVCPTHGGCDARVVCDHIAARVLDQAEPLPGPVFSVRAAYNGVRFSPFLLCGECAQKHRVPEEGLVLETPQALEAFAYALESMPVCPVCLEGKYGRQG
jgi:hypothetical protein